MRHTHSVKIITALVLLTAIIIASAIYAQALLSKDANRLCQAIEEIIKNIEENNWDKANEQLDKVYNEWSGIKGLWAALVDHNEIDNIDESFSRMRILIKAKAVPFAMSEATVLKQYIVHIPEKERPDLENIF